MIAETNNQETIGCTLPLTLDQIKHFFTNKEKITHLVDYKNSTLRESGLLLYVANLELNVDLILSDVSFEEKSKLIRDYMTLYNISSVNSLNYTVTNIVLTAKGVDTSDMFINPALSPPEVKQFIEENKTLVQHWLTFVDSLILYAVRCLFQREPDGSVEVINDSSYIGSNVVNLFNIPSFFEVYFSAGVNYNNVKYFKYQFEEYCFKGKNMFTYFYRPDNWLLYTTLMSLQNAAAKQHEHSAK